MASHVFLTKNYISNSLVVPHPSSPLAGIFPTLRLSNSDFIPSRGFFNNNYLKKDIVDIESKVYVIYYMIYVVYG